MFGPVVDEFYQVLPGVKMKRWTKQRRFVVNRLVYPILTFFLLLILSCGGGGGGGSESNTIPPAPQKVVSTGGNTEICLSWENVSGATAYHIYWSTTAGVSKQIGTKISGVSSPYYHTGLINGTTYYYVVTAANQYGDSSESQEVSAVPSTSNPPLPPSDVVTQAGDRNVIIRWSPREAGDTTSSYNIYWSASPGVTTASGSKIQGAASPYTHANLTNGTTYYYVVTGVNVYGEGRVSIEVSATPDRGNMPYPPTGVSATAGDRQAIINWTAAPGATSYNLYWSTSPDLSSKNGKKITAVTNPYTHTGLNRDTIYYYVVTAVNSSGESEDSAQVSVTIPNDLKDICVAMGDSITLGAGSPSPPLLDNYNDCYVPKLQQMWGKTVINDGVLGAKSSVGADYVDSVLAYYKPKYLIIYYGNNDLGFFSTDSIIANLAYMIEQAKANGTIPVIATLGPFMGNWAWRQPYATDLNKRIRALASSEGIAYADLEAAFGSNPAYMILPDGMHPNAAGHSLIANTFYNILK
jgi:lysophospholipase L1-like esterase/fibronectin type 3 domain-containing protein